MAQEGKSEKPAKQARQEKEKKSGNPAKGDRFAKIRELLQTQLSKEIFGVFCIAFTLLTVAALASFSPSDLGVYKDGAGVGKLQNFGGIVGARISSKLITLFGAGSHAAPVVTLALGLLFFRRETWRFASSLVAGGILFLVAYSLLLFIFGSANPAYPNIAPGGSVGESLAGIFYPLLAKPGTGLIGFTLLFLALLVATRLTVFEFAQLTRAAFFKSIRLLLAFWEAASSAALNLLEKFKRKSAEPEIKVQAKEKPADDASEEELKANRIIEVMEKPPEIVKKEPEKPAAIDAEFEVEQTTFAFTEEDREYKSPSLSMLEEGKPLQKESSEKELLVNSQILVKKLADFGIDGRVTMVLPGPVITLYEFEPAAGIKVSRIVNLADDLAMGLRAVSVRILAPVPGKAVVGIEVPNRYVEPVTLKKMLASAEFRESQSKLTMVLGKDTGGVPVVTDLATIPHLLIAGATGSGKSVGLNAMIMSILYKSKPSEVKFIMIDPKMLELSIYDGIPHLAAPVVTNPKKAANALRWAVTEMERRYQVLADLGFRNISGYNTWVNEFLKEREEKKKKSKGELEAFTPDSFEFDGEGPKEDVKPEQDLKPLPYIVVVIDELADLMMVASKDVEDAMTRLAQMARASGIHLMVATQRPSVDVLTGVIKANFPARISYQVTSRIDSRTILDSIGAERLLGKGDMLFLPPGTSRLQRIHGPFVTDEEVKRTVEFLKKQGKPVYNDEILKVQAKLGDGNGSDDEDGDDDEYFEQAVEIIANTRQASISMIQRRLRIGYNRAARIIETMEAKGMVGPSDGAKPRQVLIPPNQDTAD